MGRTVNNVKFFPDGDNRHFIGKVVDETYWSYLVDSFKYGRYWHFKRDCIPISYYSA